MLDKKSNADLNIKLIYNRNKQEIFQLSENVKIPLKILHKRLHRRFPDIAKEISLTNQPCLNRRFRDIAKEINLINQPEAPP